MMTAQEIIEILEGFPPDTEVRLMTQSNWPFEYSIRGVCTNQELDQCKERTEEEESVPFEDPPIVYIVEGTQLGYGDKNAWDCANK